MREKAKPGDRIPIVRYVNESSFRRLRPLDALTYQQHCQVVSAAIAALKAAGFRAELVVIDESEYFEWLGDELNTQLARAKFVATRLTDLQED